jgi:glycosyltransferase involved in cell wall biosynthesis
VTTQPLVSIVTTFLNEKNFLPEAIASVFAQSYGNWEFLMVDDGSTDLSAEIARRCAEKYPDRVRYLDHEDHNNRGMSASRNLGVRHARGKYIALLDADDVWLPQKLEEQVAILESHPEAAMVYGPSLYWYSWTGTPDDIQRDYVRPLGLKPNTLCRPPTLLTLALESKAPTPCPSDLLIRRELVEAAGGFEERFRGAYQLYEDQAFLAKVYLKGSVFVAGQCWDRYRQHPDSCVSVVKRAGQKYSVGLYYLKWLEKYLSAHNVEDKALWDALRSKRLRYRRSMLHHHLGYPRRWASHMKSMTKNLARRILPTSLSGCSGPGHLR